MQFPMCESFLKPFGKAFALLFLPYLSAFLIQSDYLLRTYFAVLFAPSPNPPPEPQQTSNLPPEPEQTTNPPLEPAQTPNSVDTLSTTSGRKWRIISAISVISIISFLQFKTVFPNFTVHAILTREAFNTVCKYILYIYWFFSMAGTTMDIIYPGEDIIYRTSDGKYVTVKVRGHELAAKQHPFLAFLLTPSIALLAFLMVRGLDTNNSLSIAVVTMSYISIVAMAGKMPLRELLKVYTVFLVLGLFALIKYGNADTYKLEEDEVWSSNVLKNLGYLSFLPAALGSLYSSSLIAAMLRFDFNRYCVAQPHAQMSYHLASHPSNPKMGKGVVVPQRIPFKFSKPYYILALTTWSMIRMTTLALCLTTGFPFKSPYDACAFGILLEVPIMTIVVFLFATMRGEARVLWCRGEAWVKKPLIVKKAEPTVKEGELISVKEDESVVEKEGELIVKEGDLLLLNEDKVPVKEDLMV